MAGLQSRLHALVNLAEDGSDERKRELLLAITGLFISEPDAFSTTDLNHLDAIMGAILKSSEKGLKCAIADKLASVAMAPQATLERLAHDEIEVARPILMRSPALPMDVLREIIATATPAHLTAIAARRPVQEEIAGDLVAHGDEAVLVALASNQHARFAIGAMKKLVDRAREFKSLHQPIATRFDLPPALLTRLYFFVSPDSKKEILARATMLDPALVDEAMAANRRAIAERANNKDGANKDGADADPDCFVGKKIAAGAVDEKLLRELLDARQGPAFRRAFAYLTGLDMAATRLILKDRRFEALALAARTANLDRATFARIVSSLDDSDSAGRRADRIVNLYPKIPMDAAERIMRFWRMRGLSQTHDARRAVNA